MTQLTGASQICLDCQQELNRPNATLGSVATVLLELMMRYHIFPPDQAPISATALPYLVEERYQKWVACSEEFLIFLLLRPPGHVAEEIWDGIGWLVELDCHPFEEDLLKQFVEEENKVSFKTYDLYHLKALLNGTRTLPNLYGYLTAKLLASVLAAKTTADQKNDLKHVLLSAYHKMFHPHILASLQIPQRLYERTEEESLYDLGWGDLVHEVLGKDDPRLGWLLSLSFWEKGALLTNVRYYIDCHGNPQSVLTETYGGEEVFERCLGPPQMTERLLMLELGLTELSPWTVAHALIQYGKPTEVRLAKIALKRKQAGRERGIILTVMETLGQ